jgi:hypothetical protein
MFAIVLVPPVFRIACPLKSPSRKRVGHVRILWRMRGCDRTLPVTGKIAENEGGNCLPVKGPLAFLFQEKEKHGKNLAL